jgi:CubicO group peptidase (beta-lactamase class C family)
MKRLAPALKTGFAVLIGAAAVLSPALSSAEDPLDALVRQRTDWWATRDHALDIADLGPLETVRGGPGPAITLAAHPTLSADAIKAAIAYVEPMTTQSLLVWQGGALQLEWYGQGFGPQSKSLPASMMKPLLAITVGQAIAKGYIKSVDEPVGDFLPEWAHDPRGAITIRQLLQMDSGLQKDAEASKPGRGAELMLGVHAEKVLLETPLTGLPGAVFDYNNADPALLGLIVQRATHKRFAQWMSQSFWAPMGAQDAAVWLDRPGGLAHTACCFVATGRDWLRAGLLIKDHGRVAGKQVVDPAWIDAMIAPSPRNPNFGYNVWRASPYNPHRGYGVGGATVPAAEPFTAPDMVYFDGAVGQRVYISRAKDLVIVRIGKSYPRWDDSVLPNIIVAGLSAK